MKRYLGAWELVTSRILGGRILELYHYQFISYLEKWIKYTFNLKVQVSHISSKARCVIVMTNLALRPEVAKNCLDQVPEKKRLINL